MTMEATCSSEMLATIYWVKNITLQKTITVLYTQLEEANQNYSRNFLSRLVRNLCINERAFASFPSFRSTSPPFNHASLLS